MTIEPFPHSSLSMASVHPCKHSSVMKKVIERMDKGVVEAQRKEREREKKEGKGKWGLKKKGTKEGAKEEEGPEGLRVDQYLVVFLKFMSSIGAFLSFSCRVWELKIFCRSPYYRGRRDQLDRESPFLFDEGS